MFFSTLHHCDVILARSLVVLSVDSSAEVLRITKSAGTWDYFSNRNSCDGTGISKIWQVERVRRGMFNLFAQSETVKLSRGFLNSPQALITTNWGPGQS